MKLFLLIHSAIVEFIDEGDQRALWEGLLYAGGMFVVAVLQTLLLQQYFKLVMFTGLRVRTAVLGIVYRKVTPHFYTLIAAATQLTHIYMHMCISSSKLVSSHFFVM